MNLTALHEIIRFEVSSRLRSLATHIYFIAFFGLGFLFAQYGKDLLNEQTLLILIKKAFQLTRQLQSF